MNDSPVGPGVSLDEASRIVASSTAVGAGLVWLLREKLAIWVKNQTHRRLDRIEADVESIDARLAARVSSEAGRDAAFASLHAEVTQGFARTTRAMERIEDRINGKPT